MAAVIACRVNEALSMSVRLLIVDDEPPILDILKAALQRLGADVVALADSQQASEYLEREKFDGLIVDVRMPPPDGFELTRRARASALNSKIPVVMLTGLDDADTMRKGFRAGATCFLGKPVTRERVRNLYNAIRGLLLTEKRHSARLPFRTKVTCRWGTYGEKQIVQSLNVGEGGMLLQASGKLEVDQELTLEFAIPTSEKPLCMRAKVVRRESPGRIAVEFIDSTIKDREAIQQYVIGRIQE